MALYEPWCCQRRVHSKNCASGQHRLCWQATGERNQGCPGLSVRNKWELGCEWDSLGFSARLGAHRQAAQPAGCISDLPVA